MQPPVAVPTYRGKYRYSNHYSTFKFHQKYVFRITGDAREDEMEKNLQGVGNILGNLKNMATDMNLEISRQNEQLDTIQAKVILMRWTEMNHYY